MDDPYGYDPGVPRVVEEPLPSTRVISDSRYRAKRLARDLTYFVVGLAPVIYVVSNPDGVPSFLKGLAIGWSFAVGVRSCGRHYAGWTPVIMLNLDGRESRITTWDADFARKAVREWNEVHDTIARLVWEQPGKDPRWAR